MCVTKADIIRDRQFALQSPPCATFSSGRINYPELARKFNFASNEFSYRYNGDPLRSIFTDVDSSDESDDELFEEIHNCEEIVNTPVKECIDLLVPETFREEETDSTVLRNSFSMLVDFTMDICRRVDRFLENISGEREGGLCVRI